MNGTMATVAPVDLLAGELVEPGVLLPDDVSHPGPKLGADSVSCSVWTGPDDVCGCIGLSAACCLGCRLPRIR